MLSLYALDTQGDLHQHVRHNKRLREHEARRLFRQMCKVVASSHKQGIVLRDLKLRKFVFADAEGWVNHIICVVFNCLFINIVYIIIVD